MKKLKNTIQNNLNTKQYTIHKTKNTKKIIIIKIKKYKDK